MPLSVPCHDQSGIHDQKLYCAVEFVPVIEALKLVTIEAESWSRTPSDSLRLRHSVHITLTTFYHMHHYNCAAIYMYTGDMVKCFITMANGYYTCTFIG